MADDASNRKQSPADVIARLSASRQPRPEMGNAYILAETPIQKQLVSYIEEVLGLAPVGVEDNFFALGGDSLQMTKIMARFREKHGVELTFDDFFSCETVGILAKVIECRHGCSLFDHGVEAGADDQNNNLG